MGTGNADFSVQIVSFGSFMKPIFSKFCFVLFFILSSWSGSFAWLDFGGKSRLVTNL